MAFAIEQGSRADHYGLRLCVWLWLRAGEHNRHHKEDGEPEEFHSASIVSIQKTCAGAKRFGLCKEQ